MAIVLERKTLYEIIGATKKEPLQLSYEQALESVNNRHIGSILQVTFLS